MSDSRLRAFGVCYFLFVALGFVLGCTRSGERDCVDCNVILVTADTLRSDHVGLYGYPKPTTPNLDSFFAKGSVFETAMSTAPCTLPSVQHILTGVLDLRPQRSRLAERMQRHGYRTGAVVSHHLLRSAKGPREVYSRGFDHFDIQPADELDYLKMTNRRATAVSDRAIEWIDSKPKEEKFFLWLHYFDPHDPYDAPVAHRVFEPSNPKYDAIDRRLALYEGTKSGERWEFAGHVFSPEHVQYLVGLYDAEIQFMDAQVERVLAHLRERELLENTVVVFTSDHGERLGEDNRWDHCQSLHEIEVRVPLMVSVGGKRLAGIRRSSEPVSTLDIVPTVLELVGVETENEPLDGTALWEALGRAQGSGCVAKRLGTS